MQISSLATSPTKQMRYWQVCQLEVAAWCAVVSKNRWLGSRLYVFDLHGGPGWHRNYGDGSPVLALRAMERITSPLHKGFVCAFEQQPAASQRLGRALRRQCGPVGTRLSFAVHTRSNSQWLDLNVIDQSMHALPGWIYADPARLNDLDIDMLCRAAKHPRTKMMDIVLSCPTNMLKRCVSADHVAFDDTLYDIHRKLGKRRCLVTPPHHKNGWSMMIFTNGPQKPFGELLDVATAAGARTFYELATTKKQRASANGQMQLSL